MRDFLMRLRLCEAGATAIEYGLIVALIALALLGGLSGLADSNTGLWGSTTNKILAATES